MTSRPAPILVTDQSGFDEMLARLRAEPRIAIDTEADSLYSYYEKVCLMQFSVPGADFVLDTLAFKAIEPLGDLFADPALELVFHAAEYDILSLKRDYEFTFDNLFDTMVAARILGLKQVGLGNLLQENFGVRVDKRFQRADWGKRPLPRELIEYARDDTHYLLPLAERLEDALAKQGRVPEARAEFARLTSVRWNEREFDPTRYGTLDGARELDPVSLGALRELYALREKIARETDRPPFKVISNQSMLKLARIQPRTLAELAAVPGVGEWFVRRYGRDGIKAVERGRAHPQNRLPKPPRGEPSLPEHAQRERYARLKEWRKARGEARGVEPDVILSNDALIELARQHPKTPEELTQVTLLGEWKRAEYGEELLGLLENSK